MGNGFQESNTGNRGAREKVTALVLVSDGGGLGPGGGHRNGEKWPVSWFQTKKLEQDWKVASDVEEGCSLSPIQGNSGLCDLTSA